MDPKYKSGCPSGSEITTLEKQQTRTPILTEEIFVKILWYGITYRHGCSNELRVNLSCFKFPQVKMEGITAPRRSHIQKSKPSGLSIYSNRTLQHNKFETTKQFKSLSEQLFKKTHSGQISQLAITQYKLTTSCYQNEKISVCKKSFGSFEARLG